MSGFSQNVGKVLSSMRAGTLGRDLSDAWQANLARHRSLAPTPPAAAETPSSRRINRLASILDDPRSYLEIGVEHGRTFEAVDLSQRTAVDPRPQFSTRRLPPGVSVHACTSDAFFAERVGATSFDVVFLDGLHTYTQTYRDLINVLGHLSLKGVILIDDVVPVDEVSAIPDGEKFRSERRRLRLGHAQWQGDVFRLLLLLNDHHPEFYFRTIVGDGNEQTVLVGTDVTRTAQPVKDADLLVYQEASFGDTFSGGVPAAFRPGTFGDVVADIAGVLSGF
jgi:hypothetical protein